MELLAVLLIVLSACLYLASKLRERERGNACTCGCVECRGSGTECTDTA
jgi:hypothetical protein